MGRSSWNGAFSPTVSKYNREGCDHGSTYVDIGEPEFGVVLVRVDFNHTCAGGTSPPSNRKTYTFEVELDSFTDAQYDEAEDLRSELQNMSESEKLSWVSNNLVWENVDENGII